MQPATTHVELAPDCVERLLEAVGPEGMVEKTISLTRLDTPPPRQDRSRGAKPATPRRPQRDRKPGGRGTFEPKRKAEHKRTAPAAEKTGPPVSAATAVREAVKPPASKPAPAPRQEDRRPAPDTKPDAPRKSRVRTEADGTQKKGWAKAKPKKKKPPRAKRADTKGRTPGNGGFSPLTRKKPKKKTVRIIERPKTAD